MKSTPTLLHPRLDDQAPKACCSPPTTLVRVQVGRCAGGLRISPCEDHLWDLLPGLGTFWVSLALTCPPPKRCLNWALPWPGFWCPHGRPSPYHGRVFLMARLAVSIEESGALAPPSFSPDLTFTQDYYHRQKKKTFHRPGWKLNSCHRPHANLLATSMFLSFLFCIY